MYHLRRGARKEMCPECGKKTFTPYVDDDNNPVGEGCGRCDRQIKCRYHLPPSEFRKLYGIPGEKSRKSPRPVFGSKVVKKPKINVIQRSVVDKSLDKYETNPLAKFLCKAFDGYLSPQHVIGTMKLMGVGTSKKFGGSTVFWLIDGKGRVRDGKIMGYDSATGKRIKHPYPQITAAHTCLKKEGRWSPCMFGHNLARNKEELPIWLFESEKAALICALAFEWGGTWLGIPVAAGGCSAFNPSAANLADKGHRLSLLKDRDVILFPDEGCYEQWYMKGMQLRGFAKDVYVSTIMEPERHFRHLDCGVYPGEGYDDLILRYMEEGKDVADLLLYSYSYSNLLKKEWAIPADEKKIGIMVEDIAQRAGLIDTLTPNTEIACAS